MKSQIWQNLHTLKIHIYSTMINKKNMWSIEATICIFNNKLQKISFRKKIHMEKKKNYKTIQCSHFIK
jgi:hypothetical protein